MRPGHDRPPRVWPPRQGALRRIAVFVGCTAALTATAADSRADDRAMAEELFQEARALVEENRYEEACPKLEESQRLDPAVGTEFNLADCYEHVGRTASAYRTFLDVAAIARAAGKFEREKGARERAAALEPRLPRVRLRIAAPAPGLEVRIDDEVVTKDTWKEAIFVDPGRREVSATAPSRLPWAQTITASEGAVSEVSIPELVDPTPRPAAHAPPRPSSQRPIALGVGGFGVLAAGAGAIAGAMALSGRSSAERECPRDVFQFRCPTQAGADGWSSAARAGDISTVAFVVGGVALASAVVLWVTAPKSRAHAAASRSSFVGEWSF
jgi:hypothetical protein